MSEIFYMCICAMRGVMKKQFLLNIVLAALISGLVYPGDLAAAPYKPMSTSVSASQAFVGSKDVSVSSDSKSDNSQSLSELVAKTIASIKAYGLTIKTNNAVKEPLSSGAPALVGNVLAIPSLGLRAPLVDVGTTNKGAIDVPGGMQVGHWNGSAQPGMPGLAFLDGHTPGVLSSLSRVSVNQIFNVHYNGQDLRYKVVFIETIPLANVDMSKSLRVYGGAVEGINLMTCAGVYEASLGTYNQRLIVYSVRI